MPVAGHAAMERQRMTSVVFDVSRLPATTVEAAVRSVGVTLDRATKLRRTRYDTFDGRLRQRGLQVEARADGPDAHALRVSAADGPPSQLFLAQALPTDAPLRLEGLPRGPLRARLSTAVGERVPLPQLTISSARRSGTLHLDGIPQAVLHLDTQVRIDTPDAVPRVDAAAASQDGDAADDPPHATLEVERLPGRAKEAKALRRRLAAAFDDGDRPVKGDALDLAAERIGVDLAGWRGAVRPELDRRAPALTGVRAVLRSFADALDANWQGTIDHVDDEFLHDLRIAVRQTRSLLQQARRVLPKDVRRDQRDAFRWLGNVTSAARDLDVYVAGWHELTSLLEPVDAAALEPVLAHLAGQRAEAHREVTRALGSPQAAGLRAEWRAWLDLPDDEVAGGKDADDPLGGVMAQRLLAAQQQVLDRGRGIDAHSPATELHELRKDGKRLRYLLEGFGHLGGRKRSKATIRHLKQLQDNLGAFQDAEVQADRLRAALTELAEAAEAHGEASLPPGTLAAGERLAVALDERREVARAAFDARFAAYDRKSARRTLEELAERMAP